MRITNLQKKELADKLREAELKINDFTTSGGDKEFKIKYKQDFFSFCINKLEEDQYEVTYQPVNNKIGHSFRSKWEGFQPHYQKWLSGIATELVTATGWETFDNSNYFNISSEGLTAQFSYLEKKEVIEGINLLKENIKSLKVPSETIAAIDFKLEELGLRMADLNRFDWTSLFIGTIANLIMAFSLPQEVSGILWHFIKSSFRSIRIDS